MRKFLKSRLYWKMLLCFLVVALVPLGLVYFYINSRYSQRLKQDLVRMNRLVEKSTGAQAEEFLIKVEYISNLFFNANTQKIIKDSGDLLSSYNARLNLEKVVRVNMDLYKTMDKVDQVTFIRADGTRYHIMNSSNHGIPLEFQGIDTLKMNSYKNHMLMRADQIMESWESKLVYIRRINDVETLELLGYCVVFFDKSQIDRIFEELGEVVETRVAVEDGRGRLLYANFSQADSWLALRKAEGGSGKIRDGDDSDWIEWKYPIKNLGLTVTFYDKMQNVVANVRELSNLTTAVIVLTVFIILVASALFAKTIVMPVISLHSNLKSVSAGNFRVRVHVDTRDELGDVGAAFNEMAGEIDRLVNQVYTIQLKEKETAIAALQAQINPHFLYNTLDMIKSMADIHGEYGIGEVIVALSGVFRYATHTDSFVVTIQDELDNLNNYLKIVSARYGGKIVCTVDVPEELLKEKIVKVCLQPLVENALSHGLGRGGKGRRIQVKFLREGTDIVVRVEDDGVGIPRERMQEIREKLKSAPRDGGDSRGKSVGLKNIHDRIRLYYGDEYGVDLESREGQGTVVTVRYACQTCFAGGGFSGRSQKNSAQGPGNTAEGAGKR